MSATHDAQAHSRGESYSIWHVNGKTVELTYTLKLKDINKLGHFFQASKPGWPQRVATHIEQGVAIHAEGEPCSATGDISRSQRNDLLQLSKTYICKSNNDLRITNDSLFDFDARHMHIARITYTNPAAVNSDSLMDEKVMLNRDREWHLFQSEDSSSLGGATLITYLVIGAEHIITGWDHLAFLAAICLLILVRQGGLKTLLILISGFTIGHSISLILTILNLLNPNGLVVESMIAFSIALLAAEVMAFKERQFNIYAFGGVLAIALYALFPYSPDVSFIGNSVDLGVNSVITPLTLIGLALFVYCYFNISGNTNNHLPQILVTLLFGFVHGFGFAGSLQEIGLPEDKLFTALLSFNIGVELGQITIVGLALALFHFIKKYMNIARWDLGLELACSFLVGLGLFWFVERSIY